MGKRKRKRRNKMYGSLGSQSSFLPSHVPQKIFNINECEIWAGGEEGMWNRPWDLIIRLLPDQASAPIIRLLHGADKFIGSDLAVCTLPPTIQVPWPDGGAPNIPRVWWEKLFDELTRVKGEVYLHCLGGTGRTGTGLSILLTLYHERGFPTLPNWAKLKKDAVAWVRMFYDDNAVESIAQIKYLQSLGVHTEEKSSNTLKAINTPSPIGAHPKQEWNTSYSPIYDDTKPYGTRAEGGWTRVGPLDDPCPFCKLKKRFCVCGMDVK
jgi:hypothetical protein